MTLLASPRADRPAAEARGGRVRPSRYAAFQAPSAALSSVVPRFGRWFLSLIRFLIVMRWNALAGHDTPVRRAIHARRLVESMGPVAICIAQQIAMRLDILPLEYATEFSRLSDTAPPMSLAYAVGRIQAATGGSLTEIFEAIDPKPILSDAVSCVYQAILRDGTKVAVKVRRAEALRAIAAEHAAVDLLLRLFGWVGDVRDELLRGFRSELRPLLFEAVNFTRVARLQRIFRRDAKKHRLEYLSAAKVFPRLSGADVIVSEFISGVWLDEVVDAHESGDLPALEKLAAMDIEPEMCGRRLLHVCWWGFFESMFFSELPRASQIVVQPGGRLTFVNLGSTGSLNQRHRRLLVRALERLADHDVEGAVELLMQLLMPMPPIDLYEFTKTLEKRIWDGLLTVENPGRPWWERTGTALWLAVLRTSREHRVPIRHEISRMMQSACVYDHLAARLWPRFRLLKEFRRYRDEQHRREARVTLRRMEKHGERGGGALVAEARKVSRQVVLQLETAIDNLPLRYSSVVQKAAYSTQQLLLLLLTWAKVGLWLTALRSAFVWIVTRRLDPLVAARWVVGQAIFYGVGLFLVVLTIRRVLFRLSDVDRKRG
jgi:ubiquinone biosynthesis protein